MRHGILGVGSIIYHGMLLKSTRSSARTLRQISDAQNQALAMQQDAAEATRQNTAVRVQIDSSGAETYYNADGIALSCPVNILQFKESPAYQTVRQKYEKKKTEEVRAKLRAYKASAEELIYIHRHSAYVKSTDIMSIQPATYPARKFDEPKPYEASIRRRLEDESVIAVKSTRFGTEKKRQQWVEAELPARLEKAQAEWNRRKDAFERQEAEKKKRFDELEQERCEQEREIKLKWINGDSETVYAAFDKWMSECSLPIEISVDYEWEPDTGRFIIDVDLPDIDDISETVVEADTSGELTTKTKTINAVNKEYKNQVFSIAIYITSHTMNISPAIKTVLISGYAKRRDQAGDLIDVCLYSIVFERDLFAEKDVRYEDPVKFCKAAKNRMRPMPDGSLEPVEPFEK